MEKIKPAINLGPGAKILTRLTLQNHQSCNHGGCIFQLWYLNINMACFKSSTKMELWCGIFNWICINIR